jgi:hypothetical protein
VLTFFASGRQAIVVGIDTPKELVLAGNNGCDDWKKSSGWVGGNGLDAGRSRIAAMSMVLLLMRF